MSVLFKGRVLRSFGDHNCQDYCGCDAEKVGHPADADLVTSELPDGRHMPVIDLDLPCQLVPSGTPGNYHLYIDKAISWDQFGKILIAMEEAGIVQQGYLNGSMRRGYASVRVPWKPKVRPEPTEPAPF